MLLPRWSRRGEVNTPSPTTHRMISLRCGLGFPPGMMMSGRLAALFHKGRESIYAFGQGCQLSVQFPNRNLTEQSTALKADEVERICKVISSRFLRHARGKQCCRFDGVPRL